MRRSYSSDEEESEGYEPQSNGSSSSRGLAYAPEAELEERLRQELPAQDASSSQPGSGTAPRPCTASSRPSVSSAPEEPPEERFREPMKQYRSLQEDHKKLQEESERMRDTIEELEHENEALKREKNSRGHADAAEIRRRDEALGVAQHALQSAQTEVQNHQAMYRDAQAKATESCREVESLQARLAEQERISALQAAELEEGASRIAVLEEQLSQSRGRSLTLRSSRLGSSDFRTSSFRPGLKLADLKHVVEAPVFSSLEAMDLSWQEFRRVL